MNLTKRWTKPKITLVSIPSQFRYLTNSTAEKSVFFSPFLSIPSEVPNQEILKSSAKFIIETKVYPSMNKLLKYLQDEYIPNARTTIGCSDLPDGNNFYLNQVEFFTTTKRTPDEIHELGMSEVTRIKSQMNQIIQELNFNGTFQDFISSLKNDSRFYAKTEQEFLSFIRNIAKRADPELSKLFKTLPRCTYGVRPIDAEQAKTAPAAFYNPPNDDCSRPGYYYVNTFDLTQRPFYVYESTTLHETVPGHHFQIAIANELKNLPKFRTTDSGSFTAFVEGWALYSESLGPAMGFYTDPYYKFGSLGDEMLRACRLVVDTGMHWKKWTRQQAIDFMKENTPLSDLDIVSEIDRYITWPGQALAYKSGQLKITELREKAKTELGAKFDIREFHDAVLENGSLPLDLLQEMIERFIKSKK
jgi:prolyl oligopeptidase